MANYHSACFRAAFGLLAYASALRGKDEANRPRAGKFHAVEFRAPCACSGCGKPINDFGISTQTQAQIDAAPVPAVQLNVRAQEAS